MDRSGMFGTLSSLPEQLEEGMEICRRLDFPLSREGHLVTVGMGGSAIAGDIVASLAEREGCHVAVLRDVRLPSYVGPDDLLVFLSYSGDTWETLFSYREAQRKKLRCLTVSSGGKLQELSASNGTPHLRIPKGLPPRGALGYLLSPLLALLSTLLPDLNERVREAVRFLSLQRERWVPAVSIADNEAKSMALAVGDRTPIVYSTPSLRSVARRWQTQLNENAKVLAWSSRLPEASHNEIVGWMEDTEASRFAPIVLMGHEHETLDLLIRETVSLMEERLTVQLVTPSHPDYLSQLLELVLLGDLVSLYLAVLRGVDPFPVEPITRLKGALRSLTGQAE